MLDDFKEILEKKSKEILKTFGIDLLDKLDSTDDNYIKEILVRYLNFKNKTLTGEKYDIKHSNEIIQSLKILDEPYKKYFKEIENRILNGENIVPYQSKTIASADDNLFYQYGINHLHLSESSEEYFTERSDYVMLYVVVDSTVYFLDIVKHPKGVEWIKSDYWKIYNNNWPQNTEHLKIKGAVEAYPKFTPEEMKKLSNAGVIFFNESDDGVYMPNNPKATDSKPIDYNLKINEIINRIYQLETQIHNEVWINKQNFEITTNLNFKLVEHENSIFLCEQQNETCCEVTKSILGDFSF